MSDARRSAPHVARNAGPIIDVLRQALPLQGRVLEIASGTGEHAVHFAGAFPGLSFQPSDPDPLAFASIRAWRDHSGLANLEPPIRLDVVEKDWPPGPFDAILCINMIHISPWESCLALLEGAGAILPPGGLLYLYGPYRQADAELAPSNAAFDRDLKARNSAWGLRSLEQVALEARKRKLGLERVVAMPANNLSVLFRRN